MIDRDVTIHLKSGSTLALPTTQAEQQRIYQVFMDYAGDPASHPLLMEPYADGKGNIRLFCFEIAGISMLLR